MIVMKKSPPTYLVINADDLGMAPCINQAVVQGIKKSVITSTSLTSNGPSFHSLDPFLFSDVSMGLHATFTDGTPVLPADKVTTLVDRKGRFINKWQFFFKYSNGRISLKQLQQELQAQFDRAVAAGFEIDHLDSHHHIHCLPAVYHLFDKLAKQNHIQKIRTFRAPVWNRKAPLITLVHYMSNRINEGYQSHSTAFWGFEFMRAKDKQKCLQYILHRLKPGWNELMCHPAVSVDNSYNSCYKAGRCAEYRLFSDSRILKAIDDMGIQLSNYRHYFAQ